MPAPDIDLSIVTVSHLHREDLRAGLPGWLDARDRCRRELIVVENVPDGTADDVLRLAPDARVIRNSEPRGFAANCNAGIALARGRHVLLLNPDVTVHPGALDALVAFMDASPDVGVAGPRLLNPDGSLQLSCRSFSTPFLFALRGLGLERLLTRYPPQRRALMQDWDHAEVRDVDWVLGAAMIARRAAIDAVGPLDPGYYLYCEDQDWCHRMWTAGWRVAYVPSSVMIHTHHRASHARPFSRWKWIHVRSSLRMFRKQGLSGKRPRRGAAATRAWAPDR
jgi:N-acetylglucosaminyl-diphospho-decaprenol L-rhamnosyltransferase